MMPVIATLSGWTPHFSEREELESFASIPETNCIKCLECDDAHRAPCRRPILALLYLKCHCSDYSLQ